MNYEVLLSLAAVEDVLRLTMSTQAKAPVIEAAKQLQAALQNNPRETGAHLSEGLFHVDREPLRAFFTVDDDTATVEIVNIRHL